jgi:hypothetical protein
MSDLPLAANFAALRAQGISLLEQMNGGVWTDFNVHDPGITILEVLCYVLTDLAYRAGYSVQDLLASAGDSAAKSLYTAPEILTTNPVTVNDLRKVALDVDGVKNAWVEPAESTTFYYHAGKQEISLAPDPPTTEPPAKIPVTVKGLYHVLIETLDLAGIDGTEVRRNVALQLHRNRPACEDFVDVQVLDPQPVQVQMAIEIGPIEDAVALAAQVLVAVEEQLSPVIPFVVPSELLSAGVQVDDVLEGPRLQGGIVTDDALRRGDRRTTLNSSDIIHAVMDVPGVRAVRSLSLSTGGRIEGWSLPLDPQRVPRLDVAGSRVQLEREGIAAAADLTAANAAYEQRLNLKYQAELSSYSEDIFAVPKGRNRSLAQYNSLQHHLPPTYAVGDAGLPDSATDDRKARAKQLKGYLMLFDQLLANEFAQLAHAGELLSFQGDDDRTYFSNVIQDDTLSLEDIRINDLATHQKNVDDATEDSQTALIRKNRFLNHLMARFSEEMTDYSLVLPQALPPGEPSAAAKLIRDKQAFLQNYPCISGARGSGMNYLASGPDNRSGLEQRISLRLGLVKEEQPLLVEHILLRPMEGDDQQFESLLAASSLKDPFSLQLTFVFPAVSDRLKSDDTPFRRLVERTVREETPAHLTPYIQWLDGALFASFQTAYATWIEALRVHCSEKFDIKD